MKSSRERLTEIATTLASYGLNHIYSTRIRSQQQSEDAKNLRKAFEDLGPTFIKFGQIISTRRDLLPPDYIEELSKLRDNAPPFPFSDVEKTFKEDFYQDLDEVFNWVDETPFASASVSQVHKAEFKNGEQVVIKVQRPDMEENLLRDIRLFSRVVNMAPDTVTDMLVDANEAMKEIEKSTEKELDFRNEGKILAQFRTNNQELESVDAPKPHLVYTSKRVLVLEYIDGIRGLDKKKIIEEGYDNEDIAEKLIYAFLSQVFNDGLFHGDPHPGNIFIRNRKIVFLDFGIYGKLDEGLRNDLIKFLRAIVFEDTEELMYLLLQMTVSSGKVDRFEMHDDLQYFFRTYVNRSFSRIDISAIFSDIMNITHKHQLVMPNDFILLSKSLSMIEGIVSELHEDINVMGIALDYVKNQDDFSLFKIPSKDKLALGLYKITNDSISLPVNFKKLLDTLNNGHLKVHLDFIDFEEKWTGINKMANRLVFAVIIASLILASAYITVTSEGTGLAIFGIIIFIGAGIMGVWLLYSIFRSGNL